MRTKNETIEAFDKMLEIARLWKKGNRPRQWKFAMRRMIEEIEIEKKRYWLDKAGDIPYLYNSHTAQTHKRSAQT
jgi:hypothetical protein